MALGNISSIGSLDQSIFDLQTLEAGQKLNNYSRIIQVFKEKIGIRDLRTFQKVWDLALSSHKIEWNGRDPLSQNNFHRIETALKNTLIYSGKGIETPGQGPDPQVHEIIQFLLGRGIPSASWMNKKNIRGVLVEKDPALLRAMRDEFRVILNSCSARLPVAGSKEEVLFQAFIGNIIALIPFSYPEAGELFSIPQKIDGIWKTVVYEVNLRIELTPSCFSSPIAAYGLTSAGSPPLLTFLGTTYPAGDGFVATLLSDSTPGLSVGHAPYLMGKSKIEEWLQDKEKVRLYGMSLGGALTFHVLRNHKDKVETLDAFSPPGLYPWNWTEEYNYSHQINIYTQENDLVAGMGIFPTGEGVRIFRVIPPEKENFLNAHAKVYTGGRRVTLLKSDPSYENGRFSRKALTAFHLLFGALFVFLPILCLYLIYSLFMRLNYPSVLPTSRFISI
ncbi:MAG: hypothetical protein V4487_07080 [Chlamydiota bacterium]